MSQSFHNRKSNKDFRRSLRNQATPAERFLWRELKARKLDGKRFNRQHGIGSYIVDFYCAAERLVIELDGHVHGHQEAMARDEQRDRYLSEHGYRVVRFENRLVFDDIEGVLSGLKKEFI